MTGHGTMPRLAKLAEILAVKRSLKLQLIGHSGKQLYQVFRKRVSAWRGGLG